MGLLNPIGGRLPPSIVPQKDLLVNDLFPFQPKSVKLDLTRLWPPVTSCSFTHQLTSVAYQGPTATTPSTGGSGAGQDTSSQPKGVIICANTAIPAQVSTLTQGYVMDFSLLTCLGTAYH